MNLLSEQRRFTITEQNMFVCFSLALEISNILISTDSEYFFKKKENFPHSIWLTLS